MLGLNPTEQEVVDIPNNIVRLDFAQTLISKVYNRMIIRKGLIYFPDFCQLALSRFRENEVQEDQFRQKMFKVVGS